MAERAAFGQPSLNSLTLPPSLTPLVLKQDTMFFVVFLKQLISFVVVVQSFVTPGAAAQQVPSFVLHRLPEFTQTHVHRGGDAIQPSHPLSSPFPPAPNPSQHQGLFQ